MLDLGWSELLIIAVAALIIVGPKDLPRMLRTLGQYAARAKSVAREFQRSMDEAARQADIDELRDVKKDLDSVRQSQYKMQREMSQSFLDEGKASSKKKRAEASGDDRAAEPEEAGAPREAGAPDEAPASVSKAAPEAPAPGAGSSSSSSETEPEPEPSARKASGA